MVIEIHNPETEAVIFHRISTGEFRNAEEVIVQALKTSVGAETRVSAPCRPADRKSLAQLFADSPFKGLDIDFERQPDCGRDMDL